MNTNKIKLYYGLLSVLSDFAVSRTWNKYSVERLKNTKRHFEEWKPLSNSQKKEIASFWGIKHPKRTDYITHEIMMNLKGNFDVRYCPESVFRLKLDDDKLYGSWTDKNYYDRFQLGLPLPHTYVRNVGGCFLDHDYQPISRETAEKIICENLPLIIKPTIISRAGRGIKKITTKEDVKEIFSTYDKDYLLQEIIVQNDVLQKTCPHSVASFRLITAMVDGKPVVLKNHLLVNTTDSVAVNYEAEDGAGVVFIVVDEEGVMENIGYSEDARIIKQLPSDFSFGGVRIPAVKEAVNLALEAHKTVPMLDFIGWDITVDKDDKPVFIEWNLRNLEIFHSQMTQGPLFGEYTDYFADKVRNK